MILSAALNITTVGAGSRGLLILQCMLAAVHMTDCTLMHLFGVVTRIVDILLAELALHGSLPSGLNRVPTWSRSQGSSASCGSG